MPPKKKGKGVARAASTPVADEDTVMADSPQTQQVEETPKPTSDLLNDPWTDEQETSLFKGIIRWKPAGMHKHFRMIAISEHLRNHGYDPTIEKHTRIPCIWEKIRTMYNLDIIDKQENSFDYEDGDHKFFEFKLPEDDFEEPMFMKGKLGSSEAASSSPPRMERSPSLPPARKRKRGDTVTRNRASTVDDTDEPRTSRTNSPAATAGKGTRKGRANRNFGRVKAEHQEGSERAASKDTTMDEDDGTEDGGEEEDEEEDRESSPKPTSKSTSKAKSGTPSKTQGAPRKSKRKR
ncbi:hypothetical protein HYALB_00002258 [Hymenoscyphus albidus]|uniref:CT20-domain-containing protein n=1 Tax=Hymenoscyphus albidus TaxID=595503 RepID=A0A9N9M1Q2_9HELO|nr:hypothetical protein HYALB_00002258 [Hymenoscyphus albidus]